MPQCLGTWQGRLSGVLLTHFQHAVCCGVSNLVHGALGVFTIQPQIFRGTTSTNGINSTPGITPRFRSSDSRRSPMSPQKRHGSSRLFHLHVCLYLQVFPLIRLTPTSLGLGGRFCSTRWVLGILLCRIHKCSPMLSTYVSN